MRDEVTDDPTVVGVGAAAWVTDRGCRSSSDADGDYHLLDLPDFVGNNWTLRRGLGNPVVALSPDGRELAYGYAVFGPDADTEPIPSGIRVVDLTTGELREIPVPGKQGTAVSQIEWSPDGSWLAFTGMQQDTWTTQSMGSRGPDGRCSAGCRPDSPGRDQGGGDAGPAVGRRRGNVQCRTGRPTSGAPGPRPRDLDALGRVTTTCGWSARTASSAHA